MDPVLDDAASPAALPQIPDPIGLFGFVSQGPIAAVGTMVV